MTTRKRLGVVLKQSRERRGLYQKELGQLIGVSDRSIGKWEKGTAVPRRDHLAKLSDALELDLAELRILAMRADGARRVGP